ncbi:MAG TPA: ABC transporter permease [Candidatus Limnocylindria bacterium]|jgi:ABC-type transport system involved in multi-copper enzyme maturation permease subunit
MTNALRIAWREIRWEIFGDRGAIGRLGLFAILPVLFILSQRGQNFSNAALFTLALQSTLFPALSGVALIASTFTQEKENGTIIPLLAAPVRDIDIVVGKLIGMIVPTLAVCLGTLTISYVLAWLRYGPRVATALPPTVLYALVMVALLYLLTAGSWVLIVAALVKTSRAGQQLAGLVIGLSVAVLAGLGFAAANIADGWALVGLGAALVLSDVAALEIARRVWRREEVLARL